MSEYTTIEYYINHIMCEITKRDVEQVSERLRVLGWEEVVRCRDCDCYDHWDASGRYKEKHVCGRWDYLEIEPNGFCAWAERKD